MQTAATPRSRALSSTYKAAPLVAAAIVVLLPGGVVAGNGDSPKSPDNVRVTAASPSTLSLAWDAPRARGGRGIAGYELFLDDASAGTTPGLSYDFGSLECARPYSIGVEAVDSTGAHSARASISSSTAPCPPPNSEPEPEPTEPGTDAPTAAVSSLGAQARSFKAVADARVFEASPTSNYGASSYIRVDAGSDPDVDSYVRFEVTGVVDRIRSAKLLVFATSAGTRPAVYSTSNDWVELGISWSNRPARSGSPSNEAGTVSAGRWLEWDVSDHVSGNGTVSFVLAGLSSDGVNMGSRESLTPPQLAIATAETGSPDTTAPTAPGLLSATAASGTSASLAWTASVDDVGVDRYEIYRDGQTVGTTTGTTYSVLNLSCGRTYTLAVDAWDAAGNRSQRSETAYSTAACPTPAPSSRLFYVSPTGNDANPGSLEQPWRTVQKAFAALSGGETAYLRAGTYTEMVDRPCDASYNTLTWSNSGTALAPIVVAGYPGEEERVIVKTKLKLSGNHLQLRNLVVERNTAYSSFDAACTGEPNLNLYGDDITLDGLQIRNSNMSGIYLAGADRVSILGNEIRDNGTHDRLDHGIYYGSGVGGTIANNVLDGNRAYGIQMYPRPSGQLITQNTVTRSGKAGVILSGATNVIVTNNISAWNTEEGIRTGGGGCVGCVADQNVLYGNSKSYYLPAPLTVQATISADPLFVDRATRDYRLAAGSPAVDTARVPYSMGVDFVRRPRPAGAGPDIGSFER